MNHLPPAAAPQAQARAARIRPSHLPLASLLVLLALAACGGGDALAPDAQANVADGRERASAAFVVPLVDDAGQPMPTVPAAEPSDPGARALFARHATAAQAALLAFAMPAGHVPVVVQGSGHAAELEAAQVGEGMAAALNLGADAPVLVTGDDARAVARVADRLVAEGHRLVWAVTR